MEGIRYRHICTATILLVLASSKGVLGVFSNEYYCSISKAHTMCLYTKFDSLQLQCHSYKEIPTEILEPTILAKHNSLRDHYAQYGGGNFTVPNMLALEWDSELASIAARWAWQCPYVEDDFRDVDRFRVANLVGLLPGVHDFPELDEVWNNLSVGHNFFHRIHRHKDGSKKLRSVFRLAEPLTLLTNPYFKHVGCASAKYRQLINGVGEFRTILVCNYGPLDAPYAPSQPSGPPCSRCPSATSCVSESKYKNLCFENLVTHHHQKEQKAENEIKVDLGNSTEPLEYSSKHYRQGGEGGHFEGVPGKNLSEYYCNIRCNSGKPHTMCLYDGPTTEYDEVIPIVGDDSRFMILNVHNIVRDSFAAGNRDDATYEATGQRRTGLPLAADMREMIWSDELALIAAMWALQCKTRRDGCRDIYTNINNGSGPTYISQLIDSTLWTGKEGEFPSPESSFFKWHSAWKHLKADHISPFRKPIEGADDYSSFAQIIWADSYLMGCGMTLCRNKTDQASLIVTVCNYGPAGMIEGHNIYVKGGPCTHCKRLNSTNLRGMYCSHEYPHLCAGAESVHTRILPLSFLIIYSLMIPQ